MTFQKRICALRNHFAKSINERFRTFICFVLCCVVPFPSHSTHLLVVLFFFVSSVSSSIHVWFMYFLLSLRLLSFCLSLSLSKTFCPERDFHCLRFMCAVFWCVKNVLVRRVRFLQRGTQKKRRRKNYIDTTFSLIIIKIWPLRWNCVRLCAFYSVSFQSNALLKSKIPIKKSYFPMMMAVAVRMSLNILLVV